MNHIDTALWGVLPYLVLALFTGGSAWRYHYDRFGFTTRSSQLHEHRLLAIGGPLFHYGLLFVIAGHVMGLLIPEALTERLRVSESLYHAGALLVGGTAGLATAAGLGILLHRRLRVPAVRAATNRTDKALYPLLAAVLLAGLTGHRHRRRPPRLRLPAGRLRLVPQPVHPRPRRARHDPRPLAYRLHALLAMALFALWPFSRLVHAFTAPIGYLTRPYVVYRSRTPAHPHRHPALTGADTGTPVPRRQGRART
ncbi:respiratory nitrate reductase subunit gamma [Streptomyces sp. NPDC044780]|uniref:respiratory nitrate reductase subunit gamma n=1 Tax=unclassified Streptomyces TaxID=2593676 RepID=UPI0033C063DB